MALLLAKPRFGVDQSLELHLRAPVVQSLLDLTELALIQVFKHEAGYLVDADYSSLTEIIRHARHRAAW